MLARGLSLGVTGNHVIMLAWDSLEVIVGQGESWNHVGMRMSGESLGVTVGSGEIVEYD